MALSNCMRIRGSATPLNKKPAAKNAVTRIADEIVDLVERTNGPVLLHEIGEQVPGFSAPCGPAYSYFISHEKGETVFWDGMTEAGYKALRQVFNARRVAVQYVSLLPYLFEGVDINLIPLIGPCEFHPSCNRSCWRAKPRRSGKAAIVRLFRSRSASRQTSFRSEQKW